MTSERRHLERRVPTGEAFRDNLRAELSHYACGTVMLDGVDRETHQQLINNNHYHLDRRAHAAPGAIDVEQGVLFEREEVA